MKINEPSISRELAVLINSKRMTPRQRGQFLKAALKAKTMESFRKDFVSGVFYEEIHL
tara:strand:- start:1190 stop:1363 length:174 start_codon:yes stop_codon:yes gene_type:complete